MSERLPTRCDRYPAKMVHHLANKLVERYLSEGHSVFDPFAGSCAILKAAQDRGLRVTGVDINPVSALFGHVKLVGFCPDKARVLFQAIKEVAKSKKLHLPIDWRAKNYWFTESTIAKFESLRGAIAEVRPPWTDELYAVLLAFTLSVRCCSKADQRSPKPFISKTAKDTRTGRHFDPIRFMEILLEDIIRWHAPTKHRVYKGGFVLKDIRQPWNQSEIPLHSHIITSPPYINAQDYFRNFKLELHMLAGVMPFSVSQIQDKFVGTERGRLLENIAPELSAEIDELVPDITLIEQHSQRLADVVRRYFADMNTAIANTAMCLESGGTLVLVCGDNLIAGQRIMTWKILGKIAENLGFDLFDSFADTIKDRMLPPTRSGHRGLIKEEVVLALKRRF